MFRANMCSSSGQLTLSMRHWYFSFSMGGCLVFRPADQTATHTECTCGEVEINILRNSLHRVGFNSNRYISILSFCCKLTFLPLYNMCKCMCVCVVCVVCGVCAVWYVCVWCVWCVCGVWCECVVCVCVVCVCGVYVWCVCVVCVCVCVAE